jgi:hypothetical protein
VSSASIYSVGFRVGGLDWVPPWSCVEDVEDLVA